MTLAPLLLGVMMLGVFALLWGGAVLVRRPVERTRGVLMLVAAAVLFGNVLILTL